MAVKFIDPENCLVFLPNDVDGLAITDPSNKRSKKIITREKTPYLSTKKTDQEKEEEKERLLKLASSLRLPEFGSKMEQFAESLESVNRRNMCNSDPELNSEPQLKTFTVASHNKGLREDKIGKTDKSAGNLSGAFHQSRRKTRSENKTARAFSVTPLKDKPRMQSKEMSKRNNAIQSQS